MTETAAHYVIVGGGTAGCLLAERLSADPTTSVVLIEAGGEDRNPWVRVPAGYLRLIGNPGADWCLATAPQPGLDGRRLACPRGRILGGSSAINAMIYMRGHRANYAAWVAGGADGWGWDDVLPAFLAHEGHHRPAPFHATGGALRVEPQRLSWPVLDAALEGLADMGVARIDDFNTGDNHGAGYFSVMQRRGRRVSAAHAFLHPARHRANLRVLTGARAVSLRMNGRRVTGVRVMRGGRPETWAALVEVILTAGAIGTPHLLQLSGIGDPASLRAAGIAPVHDLPGVGGNLIDHLQIRTVFRVSGARTLNTLAAHAPGRVRIALDYALRRRGPLTMAPSQAGAFVASGLSIQPHGPGDGRVAPDIHVNLQPLSLDHLGAPLHRFDAITVSLSTVQPDSRGHVAARSPDWREAPEIMPDYLAAAPDRARAVWSARFARRLMATAPMRRFQPVEYFPDPSPNAVDGPDGARCGAARGEAAGDAALLECLARHAAPLFHPCGTARMGSGPGSVVDSRLRVRGIGGLRIADASVMPAPLSGGLAAPVMMIAERAAGFLREDRAVAAVSAARGTHIRRGVAMAS